MIKLSNSSFESEILHILALKPVIFALHFFKKATASYFTFT